MFPRFAREIYARLYQFRGAPFNRSVLKGTLAKEPSCSEKFFFYTLSVWPGILSQQSGDVESIIPRIRFFHFKDSIFSRDDQLDLDQILSSP
jgi:hypothetical protein